MPPKRKASEAAAAAGKGNAKKVYGKAPELPEGESLTDFSKKQWKLGPSIGSGGFGRIYSASKSGEKGAQFVVKMEPASNGPLFQEIHVYQRVGKEETLQQWRKQKGLNFLGIPPFVAAGRHSKNNTEFRFLVMPRFCADLESHRETRKGGRLEPAFVFRLAICCLDSLEYLHYDAQYVHADLKGENLLAASEKAFATGDHFYLVDYGLARKVADQPVYKEAPKKAHDGTLIFTSLDAHRGCAPSYRGDVEILGYNIVYWITGSLPWMKVQGDPGEVFEAKLTFSKKLSTELAHTQLISPYAAELTKFFEYVYSLDYGSRPNFDQLRQLMQRALAKTKKGGRSPASSPSLPVSNAGKAKPRSPLHGTRRTSPAVRFNGAATAKKPVPLLQNFLDSGDSSEDEENGNESGSASSSSKALSRPGIKKTILAEDTPSPSPSLLLSPRSIIPGKSNLRRYDPGSAAKRRSSILVKKKYLAPKKASTTTAAVKTAVTVSTRLTRKGIHRKNYRISSSSEDGE